MQHELKLSIEQLQNDFLHADVRRDGVLPSSVFIFILCHNGGTREQAQALATQFADSRCVAEVNYIHLLAHMRSLARSHSDVSSSSSSDLRHTPEVHPVMTAASTSTEEAAAVLPTTRASPVNSCARENGTLEHQKSQDKVAHLPSAGNSNSVVDSSSMHPGRIYPSHDACCRDEKDVGHTHSHSRHNDSNSTARDVASEPCTPAPPLSRANNANSALPSSHTSHRLDCSQHALVSTRTGTATHVSLRFIFGVIDTRACGVITLTQLHSALVTRGLDVVSMWELEAVAEALWGDGQQQYRCRGINSTCIREEVQSCQAHRKQRSHVSSGSSCCNSACHDDEVELRGGSSTVDHSIFSVVGEYEMSVQEFCLLVAQLQPRHIEHMRRASLWQSSTRVATSSAAGEGCVSSSALCNRVDGGNACTLTLSKQCSSALSQACCNYDNQGLRHTLATHRGTCNPDYFDPCIDAEDDGESGGRSAACLGEACRYSSERADTNKENVAIGYCATNDEEDELLVSPFTPSPSPLGNGAREAVVPARPLSSFRHEAMHAAQDECTVQANRTECMSNEHGAQDSNRCDDFESIAHVHDDDNTKPIRGQPRLGETHSTRTDDSRAGAETTGEAEAAVMGKLYGVSSELLARCMTADHAHDGVLHSVQLARLVREVCPALSVCEVRNILSYCAEPLARVPRRDAHGTMTSQADLQQWGDFDCSYVDLIRDLVRYESHHRREECWGAMAAASADTRVASYTSPSSHPSSAGTATSALSPQLLSSSLAQVKAEGAAFNDPTCNNEFDCARDMSLRANELAKQGLRVREMAQRYEDHHRANSLRTREDVSEETDSKYRSRVMHTPLVRTAPESDREPPLRSLRQSHSSPCSPEAHTVPSDSSSTRNRNIQQQQERVQSVLYALRRRFHDMDHDLSVVPVHAASFSAEYRAKAVAAAVARHMFFAHSDDTHSGYMTVEVLVQTIQAWCMQRTHRPAEHWLLRRCVDIAQLPLRWAERRSSGAKSDADATAQKDAGRGGSMEQAACERAVRVPPPLRKLLCDYRYLLEKLDVSE